jgi:tripartite-type tricarboxylate transporter receptor subunit TctC
MLANPGTERRTLLRRLFAAAAAPAALVFSSAGRAQGFPARPITLLVPAPPGGAIDALGRAMAEQMGKALGQTLIVDNRSGASGMLAAQTVARAAPDGYTLLLTHTTPMAYLPHMFSKMAYDATRDFAFLTQVCEADLALAVGNAVPARTLAEFLDWARANRGRVSYGSYGTGSAGHLLSAYLSESHRLDMAHVPYKGEAPMIQDMVGGQIPWGMGTIGSLAPQIQAGKLRALAVTAPKRFPQLPEVPTFSEAGLPDEEFRVIGGVLLMAPAAVSAPVLAQLEKVARDAVQSTPMKARFQVYGLRPVGESAEQTRKTFDASMPLIAKLVKASGVKMD